MATAGKTLTPASLMSHQYADPSLQMSPDTVRFVARETFMLAKENLIEQLSECRTLEIIQVTFRASPLSTSKENPVMFKTLNQPYYVHYMQMTL